MKVTGSAIDHTQLKPHATRADIKRLCEEATILKCAAVCVPPCYVAYAKEHVNKNVAVCTVIGFPLGYQSTEIKIAEAYQAIKEGATEIDVVVNVSKIKSGLWYAVEREIEQLVSVVQHESSMVLKLIFEIAYLNELEIKWLCGLCNKYGVSFAKTSTGFAHSGADLDTVKYMRALLDSTIKIKASGGIRNKESAQAFLDAGATRIGASRSVEILG